MTPEQPDVSYVPGALTAVTGDQCWALVETSPDSPAVTRTWQQLGHGAAADALLAGLIADGLGGTAGFTLLVAGADGQHRLFCRGTVGATVVPASAGGGTPLGEGQGAAARIDGAGLLTWREQVVDNAARIFLGAAPAETALRLPAASGVLLADCVIIDLANLAGREPVSYPQEKPKKSIVFFPDTITMTHPGSLADQASAAPLTLGQHQPADRGAMVPAAPTAPFTGPPAGPVGPVGSSPVRPGAPGSGVFPAPLIPPAPGPAGFFGGPGDDTDHDFPWSGGPPRTVADASAPSPGDVDRAAHVRTSPGRGAMPGAYSGAGQPSAQYQGGPPPSPQPWQPPPDGTWPGVPHPGAPLPGLVPPPGPASARVPSPPGMPPHGPASSGLTSNGLPAGPAGGLIDAPPWLSGPGEPAYQPPAPGAESGPGESGATVNRAELAELIGRTIPPDRIGPVVPALLCPSGHVNPPSGAVCRRCGAPLPHDPVPVPRPVLGVLRMSFGDVITLDRGVLMGRNPRTDFAGPDGAGGPAGEERPHVVKLPSADGDISRTHLRVTLDGWHVLVTDLNSTNGTLVTLPGREPQQLRPGEPVPVQPGTVVTLADGIEFRYEVTE